MRICRILGLSILLALLPLRYAAAAPPEPVAIVYALTGEASQAAPGAAPLSLRLFDRLPAGAAVEVAPGSRLALAFGSGRRYALGERSRATLGARDLASRSGPVRALPRVPPLPRLAPIAEDDRPGDQAGAVRIRSETISGLHPDRGTISLVSAVRLRFDPVPAAPEYRVQVLDLEGNVLFRVDTPATEVRVPPESLRSGQTYRWTAETRGRPGPVARGEAVLVILDSRQTRAREELRQWAERSGAADDLRLLEGVDRALGLREEPGCPPSAPGVVVETVTPESAAFLAGLKPGDRLVSWCRSAAGDGSCAAHGDLRSPFDWLDLQMDEVQRGGVVLSGTRGEEELRWALLPTFQGMTVTPPVEAGRCGDAALWLQGRAGQLRAKAREWTAADAEFQQALETAGASGAVRAESHLRMLWAETLGQRGEMAQAREQLASALRIEEGKDPESLGVVTVLLRLGNVLERQDELDEADRLYRRAHGLVLRAAPGSGGEAAAANNLAVITGRRGDLAQAEIHAARALAIREKLTPESDAIVPNLVAYGNILYVRGDFAGAESAFLRARKILEKIEPEGGRMATVLHNLGELAYERGDYEAAEDLFQRELALFEKLDPSGGLVRDSLIGLGEVALRQRQGARAEEAWRRALALSEELNPKGPKNALCLGGLAAAARLQGRGADAEQLFRQALAIWQEINPEAQHSGSLHLDLGLLFLEQGKDEAAETHLRTAIRVHAKEGRPLPEGYQALARLQARRGQAEEAAASYLEAVEALDAQRTRLGGARESQWLYGSILGDLYFEAAEHQIALRRPQEAWQFIERGRARGFQELLAQKDLRFAGEIPPDLYAERGRLAAVYDRVQEDLADWTPEQGAEAMEKLLGRLRDLRQEQAGVQERIRRSVPRLGALASPAPLDLAAARAALDPGTALLTYAVGTARSFLFVIEAAGAPGPGLTLVEIPVGREDLQREVEAFRRVLGEPGTRLSAVQQRGRYLYDLLVRPAEPVLAQAGRWLISSDGPLHALPFAALRAGDCYLAESWPLHTVASAAVYRDIRAMRREPSSATTELLAVGDPLYPPRSDASAVTDLDPQVETALRRGFRLEPLPATRSEVQAIAGLFPGARVLLGREATEEAVKTLAPQARQLHFACHGLLDERFPLNSGLALSIPEAPRDDRDNGLLQAWEVFEELRLDADLVTLSACDSGLGQEMGGEGLVGLARAFQLAGARSVLASLWSVSDDSTATLMQRFYTYLRQGRAKDEALRAAQLDLLRSPDAALAHPYHWAGFALSGEWK